MLNNFKKTVKRIGGYKWFIQDFVKFKRLAISNDKRFMPKWTNKRICISDKTKNTEFDYHYIYHPAWAARVLSIIKPNTHIDISSTLSFSSIVSAFIPIDFYDYRPAHMNLSNLNSKKADLMSLPFKDNSVYSISCMHTIEHIGLGRYGDSINPTADLRAIGELKRVTKQGGNILFVVPVGLPRIVFNAHRIYSFEQIITYFDGFDLKEFSLIPDSANVDGIIINASKEIADAQKYGCGCFWFVKK